MLTVILYLLAGIGIGFLFREKKRWIAWSDHLSMGAIYLLLFLLGLSVGANPAIIASLAGLGWVALVLTTGAMIGSVVASYLVYQGFFRSGKKS